MGTAARVALNSFTDGVTTLTAGGLLQAYSGTLEVRLPDTTLATVYLAETGPSTLANPVTVVDGAIPGWVAPGVCYDIWDPATSSLVRRVEAIAATDQRIYESVTAGLLKTDENFSVGPNSVPNAGGGGNAGVYIGSNGKIGAVRATTGSIISASQPGDVAPRIQINGDASITFSDGTTADTFLKRAAAGIVSVTKLGVSNAAAATTPGSCVKRIQVFDDTGASIGYLPVYSAIT